MRVARCVVLATWPSACARCGGSAASSTCWSLRAATYEDDNPPPPKSDDRPGGADLRPHDLVANLNREGSAMDPAELRTWNEMLASTQADAHEGFVHNRSIFRPVPE